MQEFSDLIYYCHKQYIATPQCTSCAMSGCKRGCGNDCYYCLKHIHKYDNHVSHYSCKKITYNYILKHGHRYASEISKAVSDIKPHLSSNRTIHAISVGCGPSTELYGIINSLPNYNISFIGFDQNTIWEDIQTFNQNIFTPAGHKVQYSYEDFFEFMHPSSKCADFLILNYFFSDLIKFHKDITDSFIEQLAILITEGRFQWVIINDIPLFYLNSTGYSCTETLIRKTSSTSSFQITPYRRHFSTPKLGQVAYGEKLCNQLAIPIVEPVVLPYSPFSTCGSIQAIITINNKTI